LANLMLAELQHLDPQSEWSAAGVQVFQGSGMTDRVRAAVEQHRPDVVFVRLGAYKLTHETVLWRVRDRWPKLYPAAKFVDARLKWLAGGPRDRADTPRPWVYTLPRRLAVKVLGAGVGGSIEETVTAATGALDYLLSLEDVFVYLWRSSSVENPKQREKPEFEENYALYWKRVLDYAERRHIPQFTSAEMRRLFGVERSKSVDGIHGSREYRAHQARFLAMKAIEALAVAPADPAAVHAPA
jgi:hypothetical protein